MGTITDSVQQTTFISILRLHINMMILVLF